MNPLKRIPCVLLVAVASLLVVPAAAAPAYTPITPTQSGTTVVLDGEHLTLDQVVAVARHGARVALAPSARKRSLDAYELLLEGARQSIPIYGFNRGAGADREVVLFDGDPLSPENRQFLLERSLRNFRNGVRSGVGPEVADEETVRAMMAVRANTMTYEAATPELTQMLQDLLNHRITPVVQSRGTPGEGDLPMMLNVAAAMVGVGQVYYQGQRMPAIQALSQAGLKPLVPFAADYSVIQSTNAYTDAQTALLLHDAKRMLDWSDLTYAMSMLGLNSSVTPLTAVPQGNRPLPYVNWQARRELSLLRGSYLFDYERDVNRIIQDPLSFRDYSQRGGSVWEAFQALKRNLLIQINASDHNPAVVPGSKPSDSWELATPWLKRYYVSGGRTTGFIVSNSNFNNTSLNNHTESFVIALAQSIAGTAQRPLRFTSTFFTTIAPADVFSADELTNAAPSGSAYAIVDLMSELQTLANPVPAQGLPLVSQVEDMEGFGRQKVARARLAVDNAMRLIAQELLTATYWMNVRHKQKPTRSFGAAPTAAWTALRTVIPWQADGRPELPAGELAYAFALANPAADFMGADGAEPDVRAASIRTATRRAARRARSRRSALRRNARESVAPQSAHASGEG